MIFCWNDIYIRVHWYRPNDNDHTYFINLLTPRSTSTITRASFRRSIYPVCVWGCWTSIALTTALDGKRVEMLRFGSFIASVDTQNTLVSLDGSICFILPASKWCVSIYWGYNTNEDLSNMNLNLDAFYQWYMHVCNDDNETCLCTTCIVFCNVLLQKSSHSLDWIESTNHHILHPRNLERSIIMHFIFL